MDANRRRVLLIWSLILCLTTVAVVGGFMMFWLRGHASSKAAGKNAYSDENVRIVSKFVAPGQDEALDLVKRALATRDPGAVASFFHCGEASPAEVVEFLAATAARDGQIERYIWLSSMDVDGLQMEGVLVTYPGKIPAGERLAFLTPNDAGAWKVDFDAFARTSKPPWKELLEGRADHAQVRVFVGRDEYFNGPFADESKWVCFAMVSTESNQLLPEGHEMLRGYCRVNSAQAKAMERIFTDGARTHRTTLEISRTQGADPRQFEITRVLAEDWVLPPKPLDGQFQ